MGAAYVILGKNVPARYLAIGTIASVIGGVQLNSFLGSASSTGESAAPAAAPKAQEGEMDIEKAINDFISSDKE